MAEMFTDEEGWSRMEVACHCEDIVLMAQRTGQPIPPCPDCRGRGKLPVKQRFPKAWFCSCRVLNVDDRVDCGKCGEARGGAERSVSEHGQALPGFALRPILIEGWHGSGMEKMDGVL